VRPRILIVGGEPELRQKLSEFFAGKGAQVRNAAGAAEGLGLLHCGPVDLVVAAGAVAGEDGGRFLADVRGSGEAVAVVAVVDVAERGRDALTHGAYDFFLEPIDFERLDAVLSNITEAAELRERSAVLGQLIDAPVRLCDLVTQAPRMIKLFATVRRLARGEAPVLIEGEPGSGRESLARALHQLSGARGAFVAIEGGGLSVEELQRAHAEACGGTLFIDGVAAVGSEVAVTLVALLDRRATGRSATDTVRVVASAGKGTARAARQGTVHDDLYTRLAEGRIAVPPLRERPGDISVIAREFLCRFAPGGKEVPQLSREAEAVLLAHDWKANVSELRTVVEAATASAQGPCIEPQDLPQPLRSRAPLASDRMQGAGRSLRDIEVEHLQNVLLETRGNKARAARILGVSRWALQRKMQKHGIRLEELLAAGRQAS